MKILTFGHIPTWAGGQQESGLANVIYQLAKHGSEVEGVDVVLAATDCYVPHRMDGKLPILGWTKASLVRYMMLHPFDAVKGFINLLELKKKYPTTESFLGIYLKRLFLKKSLGNIKPDVIHLHGAQTVWYQSLIPSNSKLVVTFHGMIGLDDSLPEKAVYYKMERDSFLSSRVNEIFFICTQLVNSFVKEYGTNGKRNLVIFNSYDNCRFYLEEKTEREPVSNNQVKLYTVASLSDRKGQMRVLEALASLPDCSGFQYRCIGGDSNGFSIKLDAYAHDHQVDFAYLGKRNPDDIRRLLSDADYMIMPSSSEGFGLTYLESIACGVPVILPKNLPIAQEKELINDNNSILLDDCSVESITALLAQIDSYHFDKKRVANSVVGYSWDDIAKLYVKEFKRIIQRS